MTEPVSTTYTEWALRSKRSDGSLYYITHTESGLRFPPTPHKFRNELEARHQMQMYRRDSMTLVTRQVVVIADPWKEVGTLEENDTGFIQFKRKEPEPEYSVDGYWGPWNKGDKE